MIGSIILPHQAKPLIFIIIGSKMEYRIPDIYEFVEGFEFEVYSEGNDDECVEDFCGWYPYKMGYSNWRDLDELKELILRKEIRTITKGA